ncbi:MAG: hydantoinase/oxoprolinase family protein [Pseudomonadota bacterium]
MSRYLIGIDTGGTYTDAVIIDSDQNAVITAAKSLTTHSKLSDGVSSALEKVLDEASNLSASDIAQVSLSTTLATNALVEGKGSNIGVLLIGFDQDMIARTNIASAIPDAHVVAIEGGHRYDGHEYAPLDEQAVRDACSSLEVDAFAVASHYAVRNPQHERRASTLIHALTGKPVSASCDLSDSLNGPLRALTAAFNARIISLIVDLTNAVIESMNALNLKAPVMIVKGDGSIAAADSVIEKPIETILSGPAASVIGARYLTSLHNFVVADMGGTTSDVATVRNGWPALSARGSNVGGYRTLVHAIDMQTIGLGGDSGVEVDSASGLTLLDTRVAPISMLATLYPELEIELEAALSASGGMLSALDYLVLNLTESATLSAREQRFIATLNPARPNKSRNVINGAADRACVRALVDRGILRRSGFTPSDAAHVLGLQGQWSVRAARSAAELLGRASYRVAGSNVDEQVRNVCQEVVNLTIDKSTRLIINELSDTNFSDDNALVAAVAAGQDKINHLGVTFTSALPLVAVGGPANVFYPAVGQRLNIETHVPQHSHVANAVGAAVGMIRSEYTIEITLNERGGYLIHTGAEPESEIDPTAALARAENLARQQVQALQETKGGQSSDVTLDVQRIQLPEVDDDSGLISARVTASCDSLPGENARRLEANE